MSHTPEPWFIQDGLTEQESCRAGGIAPTIVSVIQEAEENFVIDILDEMKDGDFERIVECVNACAGMENPAEELAQLRADKARLIEALKMARECVRFKLWKREEYLFDQLLTEMGEKRE